MLAYASQQMLLWLPHLITAAFIFAFGACVGSFMNVVIFRLPAGQSVISPPSRCPICGNRLSWGENFPILGWLFLRGKCKRCRSPISSQYMIVELLMATLFAAMYLMFYVPTPTIPWWGEIGGPWWAAMDQWSAPAFATVLLLIAGLVAMTAIDARSFTIPIEIPTVMVIVAVVAWAIQGLIQPTFGAVGLWPIPSLGWRGVAMTLLGMLGITLSFILLKAGIFRYSFNDYANYLPPGAAEEPLNTSEATAFEIFFALPLVGAMLALGFGGVWAAAATFFLLFVIPIPLVRGSPPSTPDPTGVLAADYPHARREMLIELLYLAPCLAGLIAGWFLAPMLPAEAPPQWLHAISTSLAGYLVGGGMIWGIRILGTLAFGREAMGIGDVHMLAAVGAALGWEDPIWIVFLAAFVALAWTVVAVIAAPIFRGRRRELPFGPHLALATLILMLARPAFNDLRHAMLGSNPWFTLPRAPSEPLPPRFPSVRVRPQAPPPKPSPAPPPQKTPNPESTPVPGTG